MEKLDTKKTVLMGVFLLIAVVAIYVYLNFFQTFTVILDVRIGEGLPVQEVRVGQTVAKPEDPTYEGYTFVGWFVDGEEYDFSSPVTSDLEIVAVWEEN